VFLSVGGKGEKKVAGQRNGARREERFREKNQAVARGGRIIFTTDRGERIGPSSAHHRGKDGAGGRRITFHTRIKRESPSTTREGGLSEMDFPQPTEKGKGGGKSVVPPICGQKVPGVGWRSSRKRERGGNESMSRGRALFSDNIEKRRKGGKDQEKEPSNAYGNDGERRREGKRRGHVPPKGEKHVPPPPFPQEKRKGSQSFPLLREVINLQGGGGGGGTGPFRRPTKQPCHGGGKGTFPIVRQSSHKQNGKGGEKKGGKRGTTLSMFLTFGRKKKVCVCLEARSPGEKERGEGRGSGPPECREKVRGGGSDTGSRARSFIRGGGGGEKEVRRSTPEGRNGAFDLVGQRKGSGPSTRFHENKGGGKGTASPPPRPKQRKKKKEEKKKKRRGTARRLPEKNGPAREEREKRRKTERCCPTVDRRQGGGGKRRGKKRKKKLLSHPSLENRGEHERKVED